MGAAIAIIGMGCRFPGGAHDPESFWQLLRRGGDAVGRVAPERWSVERFCDPRPDRRGKTYAFDAGLVRQDLDAFDHNFFGIMPRDAQCMDPQQRLALEVAFECIDDAGVALETLQAQKTGVFMGGFVLDNLLTQFGETEIAFADTATVTSASMTMLAARISHAFDLRGPSLTLDTACSSSLVAVHQAIASLEEGASHYALAGGVNVISRPEFSIAMAKGHFLSARGRCMAFDERADGYVRGEGAGVICLRRLEDAVAAGQHIYAVIRGSGVNHDGHTAGISTPNTHAQRALLRDVLERAGVTPESIGYVEAHGTGTQAGDKAEIAALHDVLGATPRVGERVVVGSAKTNIGHLEAAAGVAGLIKATLVVARAEIPPNLHFERPNPALELEATCLRVSTTLQAWPTTFEPRRALVNSFGYGGTNGAVLLEQAPPLRNGAPRVTSTAARLIVPISGHNESAVREMAARLAACLEADGSRPLDLIGSSWKRSHQRTRAAVVATNPVKLVDGLHALASGASAPGVLSPITQPSGESRGAFVYTGMGPQWQHMGRALFQAEPVFAEALRAFDGAFCRHSGWSLLDEVLLAPEASARSMARADVAQPANVAVQLGLTALLASWGVTPRAVVGHSVGEIAAAHVAGLLTLDEAAQVTHVRSSLQQRLAGAGGMLAVGLAPDAVAARIAGLRDVCVAAHNAPASLTLAGDVAELQQLERDLASEGIFARMLRVDIPYHSRHMDALELELSERLHGIAPRSPSLPIYSTTEGGAWTSSVGWRATYWWQNVRGTVRFADAIAAMARAGHRSFIELGPHPVLAASIREIVPEARSVATLRRDVADTDAMAECRADLFRQRLEQDVDSLFGAEVRRVPVPAYAWQREKQPYRSPRTLRRLVREARSAWLDSELDAPARGWQVELSEQFFPWLPEHRVHGRAVVPGAAYVAALLAAQPVSMPTTARALADVSFSAMLSYDPNEPIFLSTLIDGATFSVASTDRERARTQLHARARTAIAAACAPAAPLRTDLVGQEVDINAFYRALAGRGLDYGPAFRCIRALRKGTDWIVADVAAASQLDELIDPTLLDSAFQALLALQADGTFVPVGIERIELWAALTGAFTVFARERRGTTSSRVFDLRLEREGRTLAAFEGLVVQRLPESAEQLPPSYAYRWEPMPGFAAAIPSASPEGVSVLHNDTKVARALLAQIESFGTCCESVRLDAAAPTFSHQRVALVCDEGDSDDTGRTVAALTTLLTALQSLGAAVPGHLFVITVDVQAVVAGDRSSGLIGAAACGLLNVFRSEYGWKVSFIDLPRKPEVIDVRLATTTLLYDSEPHDLAVRRGEKYMQHIEPRAGFGAVVTQTVDVAREPVVLALAGRGAVRWLPATRRDPGPGEVELEVDHVGVNFKDYLKVYGLISDEAVRSTFQASGLGHECTGRVVRVGAEVESLRVGDDVLAFVRNAFSSYATVKATKVMRRPSALSRENGAVLVSCVTAIIGIRELGRLRPGERILIHQASGAVGSVALRIAQHVGAQIFATAGSDEQRNVLRTKLGERVYDSKDPQFVTALQRATGGEGIDIAFGVFDGVLAQEVLRLLRPLGRFIDIGKRDIVEDAALARRPFHRSLSYHSLDVDMLLEHHEAPVVEAMETLARWFAEEVLQPPAVEVFAASEIERVFETMAQRDYTKKLVVRMRGERVARETGVIRPASTYLVTGGTSGFGLALAEELALLGAEHLLLISRSGVTAELDASLARLRKLGASVSVAAIDVTDASALARLLADVPQARPVRGIVHAAAIFDDALLANATGASLERVVKAKLGGALNLDAVTRDAPLDFFVLCSSVSALLGNTGQAAYAAANAGLDGLARRRRAQGRPATSIQWGSIGDVGVVARTPGLASLLGDRGMLPLAVLEARLSFAAALTHHTEPTILIGAVDWSKIGRAFSLTSNSKFERVLGSDVATGGVAGSAWLARLSTLDPSERLAALLVAVRAAVGRVLRTAPSNVDVSGSLSGLGMDSLAATELALELSREFDKDFKAMDLLTEISSSAIAQRLNSHFERAAHALLEAA